MQNFNIKFARFAIFVIYFWFGLLKLLGQSPASPMVETLFNKTIGAFLPFIKFGEFMVLFAIFEMLIGVVFLIPKWERFAITLLTIHLFTTALPLVFLPGMVWTGPFVPTLEGQYIIKNLAIIGLALSIITHARTHVQEN